MENTPKQSSEGTAVVRVLATVLDRLVKANAHLSNLEQGEVTKFHALKAPGISILQYLERIYKYASCSTECFILALIYIDRLIQRHNFVLTELNVHRVVITAVLLAAKFFDDAYYNNAYYAKVGGVLGSEMNGLEVEFLFRINFSLHVKPDEFAKYQANLVSHAVEAESPSEVPFVSPYTRREEVSIASSQPPSPQTMSSQSTSPSLSPGDTYSGEHKIFDGENEFCTLKKSINSYPEYWGTATSVTQSKPLDVNQSVPSSQNQTSKASLNAQYHAITPSPQVQIQYTASYEIAQHSNSHAFVSNNASTANLQMNPSYPVHITHQRQPSLLRYNSFPYSSNLKSQDQYLGSGNEVDHQISKTTVNTPTGIRLSPCGRHVTESFLARLSQYGVPKSFPGFVNEPLSANIT